MTIENILKKLIKFMFAIFISVIQIILWLGHFFLYKTALKFIFLGQTNFGFKVTVFILSISFMAASILSYKFYGPVARFLYQLSAIWLGTFYFLFAACLIVWLIYIFSGFKISSNLMQILTAAIFIIAILVSIYGVINSFIIKTSQYRISLNNLPMVWHEKKIVVVSDIHLGPFRNIDFAKKVSKIISEQKADLVLIPGDFYDGTPANFDELAKPFGEIQSKFGVYFASGNHEEFNKLPYLDALKRAGIFVLNNQKTEIDGLQILGVDFASSHKKDVTAKLYESLKIDAGRASILLKHEPNNIEVAEKAGISLQVSGHTHNGQMWPLGLIAKKLYGKYYLGLNKLNNLNIITSSGVGTWGPPQRVGTNAEIVVITLQ